MSRTPLILIAAVLVLGGCASQRSSMRERFGSVTTSPSLIPEPRHRSANSTEAEKLEARHQQYFDKRKRRYYYFDPATNKYFWENGQPKT